MVIVLQYFLCFCCSCCRRFRSVVAAVMVRVVDVVFCPPCAVQIVRRFRTCDVDSAAIFCPISTVQLTGPLVEDIRYGYSLFGIFIPLALWFFSFPRLPSVSTPLAGPIPAEIGTASSLQILDCQKNRLSGWGNARVSWLRRLVLF